MTPTLKGIHHLTAITADARRNLGFYTGTLGMRLVKKTVNQDDVSAYHLFYGDGAASPGSDLTFFDWPTLKERRGGRSVVRTGLRVAGGRSLDYWEERLRDEGVGAERGLDPDGRERILFEDPEGQRLALMDDGGTGEGHPWAKSPVPAAHQIRGLGPITMNVPRLGPTEAILLRLMNMEKRAEHRDGDSRLHIYGMDGTGPAAELHVMEEDAPVHRQGAGGVHHVAFRVPDRDALHAWSERVASAGVPSSGEVERYYFRSLYFR
ncbi:MAG: VOC family protein, partial [Geminicoccaceae bacterium]|nr:VOC family protein [Geminicoccaceae bacterium]